jgi:hypothetical protein
LPAAAQATGCAGATWYGPGGSSTTATSGEWGVKSNWSTDAVPEGATPVCITVPGTYTVTLFPYPDTHYAGDDGGAAEALTVGATNGTQTLKVLGEAFNFEGNWNNFTTLDVGNGVTVGPHAVLDLEATEADVPDQTPGGSPGGKVLLETDTSGQPGHPFVVEGTLVTGTSSSKYEDEIHSHALRSGGSFQVTSGTLRLYNEEPALNSGSIAVSTGATLVQERGSTFTNEGSVNNSGTAILTGFNTKGKWIQGAHGSDTGNPVVIEAGGGLEESAGSGPGNFTFGTNGAGYLLGTIPKGQTITLASPTGQTTLYLGNGTLVNEGTLHLDVPAGSEGATNVEEGNLVNKGSIYATVEGNAKNVIDVPLSNEPGAVLAANSGTLFSNRTITNDGLVELAPGGILELVATTLVNVGTIEPQISGAGTFGVVNLAYRGAIEAGGTLAPTPVGGFSPSVGEEFDVIQGSPVIGDFSAVSEGFTADYTHESSEPAYVGAIYGASAPRSSTTPTTRTTPTTTTTTTPTSSSAKAKITGVSSSAGRVTVKLSCPTGASACGSVTVKITIAKRVKKHGHMTTETIVLASGTVSLSTGARTTLKLHVSSAGKQLLRKHRDLQALATVIEAGLKVGSEKVTLKG